MIKRSESASASSLMAKERYINFVYILINSIYWIVCCVTGGYAYNYLSESRYADGTVVSDGTAGIIIGIIYLLTVAMQAKLGAAIDRSEKITEKDAMTVIFIIVAVLAGVMSFLKLANPLMFAVLILCYSLMSTASPFINSLAFVYAGEGISINYGLGRGMGSAAYALASLIIGRLWAGFGKAFVPYYIIVTALMGLVIVRMLPKYGKGAEGSAPKRKSSLSYGEFFRKYPVMIPLAISTMLLFMGGSTIGIFMARIVGNVLGPEAAAVSGAVAQVQGRALALQAIVELPAMFCFSRLRLKFSVNKLLSFSVVAFFLKFLILALAKSLPVFYFGLCFQMAGYALLTPATVYYVQETALPEDRNKGQALMGASGIFASFMSSTVGGQLLQRLGVPPVMAISVIVIGLGAVLMIISVNRKKKERQ